MRGEHLRQETMFSYVAPEARVPERHPLRAVRAMVDQALAALDAEFEALYSHTGRPSIPPEHPAHQREVLRRSWHRPVVDARPRQPSNAHWRVMLSGCSGSISALRPATEPCRTPALKNPLPGATARSSRAAP